MEYKYLPGQNVLYNGECNTIFRKRVLDDKPAYLIRNIKSGVANDKVSETSLTECSLESVVDTIWSDFKYNGNNQEASLWIFNNVLKNVSNAEGISWGANADNTEYSFNANSKTWTSKK
jgi:hypothetical protein